MNPLILHDDTNPVPDSIRRIVGVSRFGQILRRRRRVADIVRTVIDSQPGFEFEFLADAGKRGDYIERLRKLPETTMIFRLPSSTVPISAESFGAIVAKLPYALGSVLYGDPAQGDVPALLRRDDMVALLESEDTGHRVRLLSELQSRAILVPASGELLDISEISRFLRFMSGATEARHFNNIEVEAGVFRKHSRDRAKMRGEYHYFHIADEAMKRFLLPTFDFREDENGATYAMEHMLIPDAAVQICHRTFDKTGFARLLDNFFAFIAVRGRKTVGKDEVRAVAEREIVEKLNRRVSQLLASPIGRKLDALLTAAEPAGGIAALTERCQTALRRALDRSQLDHLALGHGDPCLSNILFNADLNLFRLIDPRGAESREAGFMHPVYDLAKFSHSILGGYDFVNSGLAECGLDSSMHLSLHMADGGPPQWMRDAFVKRVIETGWDLELVRAIEASLFLSMLPLHLDMPGKLPAFCLIARDILNEMEARP